MEKQTEQIKQSTTIENTENAPLGAHGVGASLTEQQVNPESAQKTEAPTKRDVWESMSAGEKVSLLTLAGIVLAGVIYINVTEKSVEFFITSFLAIIATLIALGQFYNGKKQWLVIDEQADLMYHQLEAMKTANANTDILIEQNKSAIKAAQRQATAAEKTLKQTREHFEMSERPALGFEEISAVLMSNGVAGVVGVLVNSGKMPAKIISQSRSWGYIPAGGDIDSVNAPPDELPPNIVEVRGISTIHLGGRREIHFCSISPEEWGDLKSERAILLIWAKFVYTSLMDTREFILEHYSAYNPRTNVFVQQAIRNEVT